MTIEIFQEIYAILVPEALWGLLFLPSLWFWLVKRPVSTPLVCATILRTAAIVCIVLALAGLSHKSFVSQEKLAIVASVDTSDSVSPEGRAWSLNYLRELRETLSSQDEFSVLSFAGDTQLLLPPGPAKAAATLSTAPSPGGGTNTNLAQALERSLSLYPEGVTKRLVLITDGNETIGKAKGVVRIARQMGVEIYPVIPPSQPITEVSLEKFMVPPLTRAGGVFDIRLVVRNSHSQPVQARANIFADDRLLTRQVINLIPGLSVLEIPSQILERGNYLLRAEIEATQDTIRENNVQTANLAVSGKPRALVITNNPRTHLARALELKEVDIEFRSPEALPRNLTGLLDYNSILFDDVARRDIDKQQMNAIEKYVRDFGGGFLMAGGTKTFGNLAYRGSAIERILPVSFNEQRPKKKKRIPIALFLLIDRSNSMGYNSQIRGLHDGQKMVYAQKAATAVLEQLRNTDRAGAIAFDSEAYALAPLNRLSKNRARLNNRISRLRYGGGTDFYQALEAAADQLSRSRRSIRHIILLTDGDTNRSPTDHYPLIKTIAQRQISITTIRIGSDTVNLQLLSYMSEKTGGRFYHVEDVTKLPQLLVKDTRRTLRTKGKEDEGPKDIVPLVDQRGQILRGLAQFPALEDYMLTRPKQRATVQLYTDAHKERDPLLATWQYGLGKVVAVPFDPSGSGSGDWIRWNGFSKFWSQAVRWAMRAESPFDYRAAIIDSADRATLRVESFESYDGSTLFARVGQTNKRAPLALMPTAPRIYTATLPRRYEGSVPVTLIKRQGTKIVNQRKLMVPVDSDGSNVFKEYRQKQPNKALLHTLADATGGKLGATVTEITSRVTSGTQASFESLGNHLILFSVIFILIDIALRFITTRPATT